MTSENAILTFEELDLSPQLLKALAQKGYKRPTSVQEQTIPYALDGRDLLGSAPTGTALRPPDPYVPVVSRRYPRSSSAPHPPDGG